MIARRKLSYAFSLLGACLLLGSACGVGLALG
jgi:hypothetical protein